MSAPVLPFPAPAPCAPPDDEQPHKRKLTSQQMFIAEAWRIFREVEAEIPPAGQLGLWKRIWYNGDGDALLEDLLALALSGLLKTVNYTAAVLKAGVERGEYGPRAPKEQPLPAGTISRDGKSRYMGGGNWEPVAAESRTSDDFELLWSACAKRVDKVGAARAFAELSSSGKLPPISELVAKLTLFQTTMEWCRDDRQFQPHLVNWLKREGWLDEIPGGA